MTFAELVAVIAGGIITVVAAAFACGYHCGREDTEDLNSWRPRRNTRPYRSSRLDHFDQELARLSAEEPERLASAGELRRLLEHVPVIDTALLAPAGRPDRPDEADSTSRPDPGPATGEFRAVTDEFIAAMTTGEEAYRKGMTS